ncbi:MAG: MOSC domain-containing protein [Hyphomicrobiales bacterium]
MTGRLIGIAWRGKSRAPMQTAESRTITLAAGLAGDCKGAKFPERQITILSREDWEAALATLGDPDLPWTARRANLLVENVKLPRAEGSQMRVGAVRLEVTGQTSPCEVMERAFPGLRKALSPEWRGGVTCKVIAGGEVQTGDEVSVSKAVRERKVLLPE